MKQDKGTGVDQKGVERGLEKHIRGLEERPPKILLRPESYLAPSHSFLRALMIVISPSDNSPPFPSQPIGTLLLHPQVLSKTVCLFQE